MRSLATFSHFEFIMISAFVVFARDSMESKTRSFLRETQKLSHYCPFFLHPNKTMIWWRRWPGRLKNSLKIWNCLVGERWTFFGSQKKRLSIKKKRASHQQNVDDEWINDSNTDSTIFMSDDFEKKKPTTLCFCFRCQHSVKMTWYSFLFSW